MRDDGYGLRAEAHESGAFLHWVLLGRVAFPWHARACDGWPVPFDRNVLRFLLADAEQMACDECREALLHKRRWSLGWRPWTQRSPEATSGGAGGGKSPRVCHALHCSRATPPRMLMCRKHWAMVPRAQQIEVWRHYRPGQEEDKRPSIEYLAAATAAVLAVAGQEGLRRTKEHVYILPELF